MSKGIKRDSLKMNVVTSNPVFIVLYGGGGNAIYPSE